jgi:DNA recombination protein RmuC
MTGIALLIALVALLFGGLIGWLVAGRQAGALAAERDALKADRDEQLARFKQAAVDLEAMDREREAGALKLATLAAERDAQIAALAQARDALAAQFQEVGAKLLDRAQAQFLETAGARFQASEAEAKAGIQQLLAPVNERLQRYESAVEKVENDRRDAFGQLNGLMESLRASNESVKAEAARLSNSLRNAPKARGRWGEQQLRNVLESCGLSEYADFQTEVSVDDGEGGRLRPDVVLQIPGGQSLVIDAKVSLNAYQDAFNAQDEATRALGLAGHAAAVKAHVNALGNKAYWAQFDTAPDYVILFIPGEHFLSAALENDPGLWDFAFEKRVLLATPTNLIAIARTVAAVWRQERVVAQAKDIAVLGKELYARMATMGSHIARVGKNLDQATGAYNAFVGSFESQVLTSARRFEALDIDTGGKSIDPLPVAEQTPRPLVKLASAGGGEGANDG